jgi:hypothetical protein
MIYGRPVKARKILQSGDGMLNKSFKCSGICKALDMTSGAFSRGLSPPGKGLDPRNGELPDSSEHFLNSPNEGHPLSLEHRAETRK